MRKMLVLALFISLTPFAGADASAAATKLVIVHANHQSECNSSVDHPLNRFYLPSTESILKSFL